MRALLDVSVLIALLDADHSLHARATLWFASHARGRWASCPITQNGCIRIMSHPGYPNALSVRAVMERPAGAPVQDLRGILDLAGADRKSKSHPRSACVTDARKSLR